MPPSSTSQKWKTRAKKTRTTYLALLQFIFPFHAAAWAVSSELIQRLLEDEDGLQKDRLTAAWKDNTLSQLNAIGITSALFGGVIATSFTWPAMPELSPSTRATIVGIWYPALVFALASIGTSAQQVVALNRLGSHPEGLRKIREMLGRQVSPGRWKPRKLQLIIWQTPHSFLNTSIVMFAIGLSILVWSSVSRTWVWDDIKVVTLFTVALVYASLLYLVTAFGLYHRISQT